MSELSALRMLTKPKAAVTATGKSVDIAKGFKVRAPDGTVIPFKPGTDLEKAKTWTKNFYRKSDEFEDIEQAKHATMDGDVLATDYRMIDKASKSSGSAENFMDYTVDEKTGTIGVKTSKVGHRYKGKGVGAGMYRTLFEKAKKSGAKVQSDAVMSPDAIAIWRRFKELGYPIAEKAMKEDAKVVGSHVPGDTWFVSQGRRGEPLFEYDPLEGKQPALLQKQAGEAPGDAEIKTSGALVKPQAGEKRPPPRPGIYLDDETGEYHRIDDKGNISPIQIKDSVAREMTEAK